MNPAQQRFGQAAPRTFDPWDGVLIVDKPGGPTSHDVVDRIRRTFKFQKVGHGGTLDPQATGLLVILLGKGTKLSDRFMGSDKIYEGVIRLGIATDSHDADGVVLSEADCTNVTQAQVEAEMQKLTGDLMQVPPMVSAVKVDGVPLYKRARKGQTVERAARLIHVYEFRLLRYESPRVWFRMRCTKGTYVRKLSHDVGAALGCGAHLEQLRRTASGELTIEQALPLDDILRMNRETLRDRIIPMHKVSEWVSRP